MNDIDLCRSPKSPKKSIKPTISMDIHIHGKPGKRKKKEIMGMIR